MEIYVEPANDWIRYDENFTMKFINLTWYATNFTDNILDIKINFHHPLELSPLP